MNLLSKLLAAAVAIGGFAAVSPAYSLDKPTGDVILTVRGPDLKNANVAGTAQFDRDMLRALEQRTGT
ncbi:MAG: oxidoreductase, partial [Rhizobiales bacterium]|nr:oxidoreductase [Hyphomicrobiales bacterium]